MLSVLLADKEASCGVEADDPKRPLPTFLWLTGALYSSLTDLGGGLGDDILGRHHSWETVS